MTDCQRKTIFGRPACRFEPRYDKGAIERSANVQGATSEQANLVIEGLRRITYIRDVCTSCGKTIERQSGSAPSIHELVQIFEKASNAADPFDQFAGNPAKWPVVRGVTAVRGAIIERQSKESVA